MLALLLSTLALPAAGPALPAGDGPPVRLWVSDNQRFRAGENVRVQVDAGVSGHLLVLHFSPDGRVGVLFPVSPGDDDAIRSGRTYELRSDAGDAAFRTETGGQGLIYAAVSTDAWRLDPLVDADRWNLSPLQVNRATTDPEENISTLLQRYAGRSGFDYDALAYQVTGRVIAGYDADDDDDRPRTVYVPAYYWGQWSGWCWGCRYYPTGVSVAVDYGYDCWSSWYCGESWNDYGYYRNSYYGYGYGGYYGGWSNGGSYPLTPPARGTYPYIAGRPRGYEVGWTRPAAASGASRAGQAGGATPATFGSGGGFRPRGEQRPSTVRPDARAPGTTISGDDAADPARSPARRSRPDQPPQGWQPPAARNDDPARSPDDRRRRRPSDDGTRPEPIPQAMPEAPARDVPPPEARRSRPREPDPAERGQNDGRRDRGDRGDRGDSGDRGGRQPSGGGSSPNPSAGSQPRSAPPASAPPPARQPSRPRGKPIP